VRPQARYERSLGVLRRIAGRPEIVCKTGIMLGLGETRDEVVATMRDIAAQGTHVLTIGQYLRPSPMHLPIERYWTPDEFASLRDEGMTMGYRHVESGPLVRSSYRAERGGDITYHGPGQLVGYPVVRLGERADLVRYVRGLENALIAVLGSYGVAARSEKGKTGVWVDLNDGRPAKIAAIGVRVSRGVTTHGFALNVSTDLEGFDRMLPCGFAHEVASLARLGVIARVSEVAERSAVAIASRL